MRNILKIVMTGFIAASLACTLTACGGGSGGTGNGIASTTTQSQSVQYTLSAQSVSSRGEAIPITLRFENGGNTTTTQSPYIEVYKDNTLVLSYISPLSSGTTTSPFVFRTSVELLPGTSSDLAYSWDQKDSSGAAVMPGNYTIRASDATSGVQLSITIQINP